MKLNFVNYLAKLNKILFNLEREKIILYGKIEYKTKKLFNIEKLFCDPDGTRTRDLRRDRAAF